MNPTSADPTAPPPQLPPQPPRSSFSCDRHPAEQFTGFCPSCLCERLTSLDNSSSNTPSSSRRASSASAAAAAAIKSIFSGNSKPNYFPPPQPPPKAPKPTAFSPQLRRTKSFSASKNEALGSAFEPQRKSCDVRVRSTLWSLFSLDDEKKSAAGDTKPPFAVASAAASSLQNYQNCQKIESSVTSKAVFEDTETEVDFRRDPEIVEDGVVACYDDGGCDGDEIRSVGDLENLTNAIEVEVNNDEIVEDEVASVSNLKPMKDHIDLHSQEKKNSGGGGLWAAASVFSKKWQKWRRKQKQKQKKQNSNVSKFTTLPVEKPIARQYRETQSEIADYGFGRRSCDTDPRFSLDAGRFSLDGGRISIDGPRYSFEEPWASWDGYLIGRSFTRMAPMVSVMEDVPSSHIARSDMQIPVEESTTKCANEEVDVVPGNTSQTREYYSDSSSRRRKSLDRSSSIRKTAAAVVAEIDERKTVSNAKISPTSADSFHRAKVMLGERESRDSNTNSLRDDCSETHEFGNGHRDGSCPVTGNIEKKESKKSRGWSWRIWGFIHRRHTGNKDEEEEEEEEEEEKCSRANGVERSYSESWQELRTERNGDARVGLNRNMLRSNSSVSWRNSHHIGGSFGGSARKTVAEVNGHLHERKSREEMVLEKNRSARYSPTHFDNGLLRFYLAPLRSSRRGGRINKVKPNSSHSIARSVLRLY